MSEWSFVRRRANICRDGIPETRHGRRSRRHNSPKASPVLLGGGGLEPIHDEKDDGSEFVVGVECERWSCVIEVGEGTVEISVGPRDTLHELAGDFDAAVERVEFIEPAERSDPTNEQRHEVITRTRCHLAGRE